MDLLHLNSGAAVRTAKGTDIGKVSRFVVDPSQSRVTHIVVEKGILFTTDRVIPIRLIDRVEEGAVVLVADVDHEHMPEYDADGYASGSAVDELGSGMAVSMWRYPILQTGIFPAHPTYPPATAAEPKRTGSRTTDDADLDVLDRSAAVMSIDGEKLGNVAEVGVTPSGELSHLIVDLGMFSGQKLLPAHWIERIEGHRIHLAVGDASLQSLPDVET